ncbi:MAG TPA: chemotaxis protein CheW [Patescibacteria group bacterium]|nr:chemotaxis protein CheW [Patescibacteria group bacterium]
MSPIPSKALSIPGKPGTIEPTGQITACWNEIGVTGDGSCVELKSFIHCRNCPVYSAAGTRLIDRPLPANYRQEWTQYFAEENRFAETGSASVILFRIQKEWLAMPTHSFQEVAERRPIHSLPKRREGVVLGLANVRGELVICISVGHLLQVENMLPLAALRQNYQRLLVLQWESSRLAFPVEEVHGPHRLHPQDLKPPPSTLAQPRAGHAQAVFQWQGQTAGLLDPGPLFTNLQAILA